VKLTDAQKTVELYTQLRAINDLCFTDIDNPPGSEFLMRFDKGDVFVRRFNFLKGMGFGDIVAYAIVNTDGPTAHLWQIATHPYSRGCGYATDLLKTIEAEYTGNKFGITLQVKVDNTIAQVLYLKNGYRVESVLYGYFGPEQNGLLMRKEF
jgi:ribosomal protein S18 acetylase RimI-like enzyme